MNRITFTMDGQGRLVRVCADRPVDVYFVSVTEDGDHAHAWSHVHVGIEVVDKELDEWPVGDMWYRPRAV